MPLPDAPRDRDAMISQTLKWINAVIDISKSLSTCPRLTVVACVIALCGAYQLSDAFPRSCPDEVAQQTQAKPSARPPSALAAALFEQAEKLRKDWKAESTREAIKKYREALAYWQASVAPLAQAKALIALGDAYATLSENRKRLNAYEQALKLIEQAQDTKAKIETLNKIAWAYIDLGEVTQAFRFCNQSLALSRKTGNRPGEAEALSATGSAQGATGDMTQSIETLRQALNLWQSLADHHGQAEALINLGYLYDNSGELHQALDAYKQSLEHSQKAGDRQGEALALSAIGRVQAWLGEKQTALDYYQDALKRFREMGFRNGEASTWNNIGAVYEDLRKFQKALESYSRALHLYRLARHRSYEALTIGYVGKMHLLLGDKKRALEHFNQKLGISRAVRDSRMQGYTLRDIGSVYEAFGQKKKALACYNQALKMQLTHNDRRGQAYTLLAMGQTYEAIGDRSKAIDYYQEAFQLIEAAEDRSGEVSTLFNIARAERDLGHLNEARSHIEGVLQAVEQLRHGLVNQEMRLDYFAHAHQYRKFYIALLMRLYKQQGNDEFATTAFEVSERARARVLLELLAEARVDIRSGVDDELLQRERLLHQQIEAKAAYNARLLYSSGAGEQVAKVKQELANLLDQYQEVQAQIRVKSPHYAELVQPMPLSLNKIQQQVLDADTMLLEYSLDEPHSYLWAVTPSSISSYELPGRSEIERIARAVLDTIIAYEPQLNQLASPLRSQIKPTGEIYWRRAAQLSQVLLGPVAAQLSSQRLLIVAEGILQFVPFAALPVPERPDNLAAPTLTGKGAFSPMLIDHEIISLPSASVLAMMRRQVGNRPTAEKAVAVIADPVFDHNDARLQLGDARADVLNPSPFDRNQVRKAFVSRSSRSKPMSFPRLPFTRREASAILASATDEQAMEAVDFQASRATALSAELSRYRMVHIASHGWLDSEHPELSAIVLSLVDQHGQPQNGFLRLHDIYNMNLSADLVVLSACQTALGKDVKGEGLIGLTRGFTYAGATRVVSSLWRVDDQATAELMGRFYHKILKEHLRPAAALRSAQLEIMSQKQWQSPYYWAAFILQGDWN